MLKPDSALDKDQRTARYGVELQHRHFSFIAAVLKEARPIASAESDRGRQYLKMVAAFVAACRGSNPRFDEKRFLSACGLARLDTY